MKKIILSSIALLFTISLSFAQSNTYLKIYAGSNAPWGKNQSLTIDNKGNCKNILTEVNKGDIDSSSFTLAQKNFKEFQLFAQQAIVTVAIIARVFSAVRLLQ